MRVIVTASRHLDVEGGLDWPGPELFENGDVPIAVTGDGSLVCIPLYRADGIRHGMITGTTRVGKSVTSVSVLVPGVAHQLEIVLYLDGKRGTSAPYLKNLVGKYARRDEQWPILIEIAYRIMIGRQDRRGAAGLHEFNAPYEDDPIITVFIDEPGAVKKSRFVLAKHERMVSEILEQGGALGVRLIQCGQSAAGEDVIGNVQGRGLMSSGWSINHRAGGKGATRLALDSAGTNIPLNELRPAVPPSQWPGRSSDSLLRFAMPRRTASSKKRRASRRARCPVLTSSAPALPGTPRTEECWTPGYVFPPDFQLTAGVATSAAVDMNKQQSVGGQPTSGPDDEDDLPSSRLWVLAYLADNPDGLTLGQLADIAKDEYGAPKRRTISNALVDLMGRRQVSKAGQVWVAVPTEAVDDLDDDLDE